MHGNLFLVCRTKLFLHKILLFSVLRIDIFWSMCYILIPKHVYLFYVCTYIWVKSTSSGISDLVEIHLSHWHCARVLSHFQLVSVCIFLFTNWMPILYVLGERDLWGLSFWKAKIVRTCLCIISTSTIGISLHIKSYAMLHLLLMIKV